MPIFTPSRGWTATLASYRKGRATGLRKWNKEARERPAWAAPFAFDTLPVNLPAVTSPAPHSTCNDRRSSHATRGARWTSTPNTFAHVSRPHPVGTNGPLRPHRPAHPGTADPNGGHSGAIPENQGAEASPHPEAQAVVTGPSVCGGHWHRCKSTPSTVRHFRACFPPETRATPGHGATTPDK